MGPPDPLVSATSKVDFVRAFAVSSDLSLLLPSMASTDRRHIPLPSPMPFKTKPRMHPSVAVNGIVRNLEGLDAAF